MKRASSGIHAGTIGMRMAGRKAFEDAWRFVPRDCRARDDARHRSVFGVMIERRGHRPRGLADDNRRMRRPADERATGERARDQSHGIDGVNRRTENVVEIGPQPLERTAQ